MSRLRTTLCITVVAVAAGAGAAQDCNAKCHVGLEYCDKFEGACRSCRELCTAETAKMSECEAKCPVFLRQAIFKTADDNDVASRLRTVEVLVAAVVALAAVSLLVLVFLLVLAVRGVRRRVRHKTAAASGDGSDGQAEMALEELRASSRASTDHGHGDRASVRNGAPLRHERSLQTVTTQLSSDDATVAGSAAALSRRRLAPVNGFAPAHLVSATGSRVPSEDRVVDPPMVTYDNQAMVTTPTGFSSPNGNGVAHPYTISHTRVM